MDRPCPGARGGLGLANLALDLIGQARLLLSYAGELEGRGRDELIALFLATLELVRLGGVSLKQSETFAEIVMTKTENQIDTAQFALFDA